MKRKKTTKKAIKLDKDFERIGKDLTELIGESHLWTPQDALSIYHLINAIKLKRKYFVTNNQFILNKAEEIKKKYNIICTNNSDIWFSELYGNNPVPNSVLPEFIKKEQKK